MTIALADIHVKVDSKIKSESEAVLGKIGISMSDLINMTLRRVIYERRIPFGTQVPEKELPEAMRARSEAELVEYIKEGINNDDGTRYTVDELRASLGLDEA